MKGGQGLTVDRDRIVGRARLIPRRNDHRSCALILSERLVAWRASRLSVEEQLMKRLVLAVLITCLAVGTAADNPAIARR